MNILYIVLYVYRMTEHTKRSIVVHYELDKGIESEKKNCLHCTTLGNIPFERAKDAVCFLQWCGVSLVSSAIIRRVVFAAVWREPGAYII